MHLLLQKYKARLEEKRQLTAATALSEAGIIGVDLRSRSESYGVLCLTKQVL